MFHLEEKRDDWFSSAIFAFVIVGILVIFWPSLIEPFRFFEFWTTKGSVADAITGAWPMYLWGVSLTLFAILFLRERSIGDKTALFAVGFVKSLKAGVFEEMAFRWIFLFSAMVMLPIFDFIFLGFMDVHIFEWIYVTLLCPIANFFTLGYLESYLVNSKDWVIGAAIISSNGRFRNGHGYQGLFGFTNSWFIGMYLYWIVFTFGIIPAIVIHFLYDFFIFTLEALFAESLPKNIFQFR